MDKITVVVPCYNEEDALPVFYREMKKIMDEMRELRFELMFVDDGSTDGSLAYMEKIAGEDRRCGYLSFSRNFGKEAAIYAGLEASDGDFTAVMDVDLQDPPALLPEMYRILKEEPFDVAAAKRATRTGESKARSFLAESFYKVINKLSRTQIVNGARDYRLMKRKVVDAILSMREYNRFSKGIFSWVGFRTKWLEYDNIERCAGGSKWPVRKLFQYSMDGITGFSVAPLSFAFFIGVLFCIASAATILFIVIRTLIWGDPVSGWPSLACIVFLVGGVQLLCTGIIGQYLSKTYLETKKRPIYILQSYRFGAGRTEEERRGETPEQKSSSEIGGSPEIWETPDRKKSHEIRKSPEEGTGSERSADPS